MKTKYRIVFKDGRYSAEQKFGLWDWRIITDYYNTSQEVIDELREIAKERIHSMKKAEVVDKYVIDRNGLRRDMYVNGKVVSAYCPLDEPPVPEPSK